jgi:hypothetical protein
MKSDSEPLQHRQSMRVILRTGLRAVADNDRAGGPRVRDPMIEGTWVNAARMPKRVVVEFSADEYRALEAACCGRCVTAAELVRLVALRLARVL